MKNQIKVLIGDDSAEYGISMANDLRTSGIFAYTRHKDGKIILNAINNDVPDVVIVDLTLPNLDAIALMKSTKSLNIKQPAFIIISTLSNSFIEKQIIAAGAAYFIIKPFSTESLCSIIKAVATSGIEFKPDETNEEEDLEVIVTDIIHQMGVPAHIKGYHYLRTAILSALYNQQLLYSITKSLYPTVASSYNTTSSRVERAIRHAISLAWDRGNIEFLNGFFGYNTYSYKNRPTNSEFIALITDKVRIKYKYVLHKQ